jgi:hypothetical protein
MAQVAALDELREKPMSRRTRKTELLTDLADANIMPLCNILKNVQDTVQSHNSSPPISSMQTRHDFSFLARGRGRYRAESSGYRPAPSRNRKLIGRILTRDTACRRP